MKGRAQVWLALQALLTVGLAALIALLARSVLLQVDRAAEEKVLTLARTVVAAIQGVIRHGPDQEGRVHDILDEVANSPEVRGVGIVDQAGTPFITSGAPLPGPAVRGRANPFIAQDDALAAAVPFEVKSDCMSSGACPCSQGTCRCGTDESWAVPAGTYTLVLTLDRSASQRILWPVVSVAALGVAILIALLFVSAALVRSLRTRERLTRDVALEQQRRQSLESLGLLAAGLAHEIRNPLGAIRGLAQLLREQAVEQDSQNRAALMIDELDRVSERLEEFLGFARKRQVSSEPVDLTSLARKAATLLGPDAEAAGIELRVSTREPQPISVTGDAAQLEELLINLVLNAIESSSRGGRIELEVFRRNGMPVVTVTDQGCGIPIQDLPRVFEPYFTTKKRGSGLGLAISRRIAEDHRAVLTLDSGPSNGAIARLEFLGERGALA